MLLDAGTCTLMLCFDTSKFPKHVHVMVPYLQQSPSACYIHAYISQEQLLCDLSIVVIYCHNICPS